MPGLLKHFRYLAWAFPIIPHRIVAAGDDQQRKGFRILRAIMGLETPKNGEIILHGKNIASLKPEKLARKISFVTTDKVRIANLRCKDVVALGRAPYTNWIGQLQAEDEKRVVTAMHLVGMSDYAEKTMDKMSDGECQRIMIARALAQDTPIILLDEPTAFLDLPNRYELCLLLKKLAQTEGKCILFSTHDLDIALSLCDTIMLIDNPQLTEFCNKPEDVDYLLFPRLAARSAVSLSCI